MSAGTLLQVNKAVIAVPAKFSPQQREATGAAYKAAGLKVRAGGALDGVVVYLLAGNALFLLLIHLFIQTDSSYDVYVCMSTLHR